MKITRRELSLLIENYLLEQAEEVEDVEDTEGGEGAEEIEDIESDAEPTPADDSSETDAADSSLSLKLDFELPGSKTKAKLNVEDSKVQIVFVKRDGTKIDLNQELSKDPTKKKEIEDDIKGTMMAAIEKIKDPDNSKKIRSAFMKMLGQTDEKIINTDHDLVAMKKNVLDKYGEK